MVVPCHVVRSLILSGPPTKTIANTLGNLLMMSLMVQVSGWWGIVCFPWGSCWKNLPFQCKVVEVGLIFIKIWKKCLCIRRTAYQACGNRLPCGCSPMGRWYISAEHMLKKSAFLCKIIENVWMFDDIFCKETWAVFHWFTWWSMW